MRLKVIDGFDLVDYSDGTGDNFFRLWMVGGGIARLSEKELVSLNRLPFAVMLLGLESVLILKPDGGSGLEFRPMRGGLDYPLWGDKSSGFLDLGVGRGACGLPNQDFELFKPCVDGAYMRNDCVVLGVIFGVGVEPRVNGDRRHAGNDAGFQGSCLQRGSCWDETMELFRMSY